jgi:hypothetical protein
MAKRKQSPLAKLQKSTDDNCYETTHEDCRFWFGVLNQELFNNRLTEIDVDIRWRRGAYARYQYPDNGRMDQIPVKLLMNKKYRNKKFFVEVLAHELIHHYQFLHDEPVGHGPSFMRWEEKFNKKGLNLARAYYEE